MTTDGPLRTPEVVGVTCMLMGRTAAPLPDVGGGVIAGSSMPGLGPRDRLGGRDLLVVEAVPGGIPTGAVVSDLLQRGCRPIWARLAPYELDLPALTALARVALDGGPARRRSGEAAVPARHPVAVVESPDRARATAFLDQVVPEVDWSAPSDRPGGVVVHLVGDAEREPEAAAGRPPAVPGQADPALRTSAEAERRLAELLAGRPGLLRGVRRTVALLGGRVVTDMVLGARTAEQLTRGLAGALLAGAAPEYRQGLGLAALLGYAHEHLDTLSPVLEDAHTHPWWIPLEGGWYQVDPAWRAALTGIDAATPPVAAVARVVGDLVAVAAPEEALEFCLDAACPGLASDLLAELAPTLLAADRTRALHRWLSRLPPQEHARHAGLLARLGPAAAATGTDPRARDPRSTRPGPRRRRWRLLNRAHSRRALRPTDPVDAHDRLDVGPSTGQPVTVPAPAARRETAEPFRMSVRLLGTVEVRFDDRVVEHWHGRVGRTALAYVLLQKRRVPPEELAGALWPDVPAATARNRLHVALHRLRADLAAVDERPVLVHEQGYAVEPLLELDLDTDRFERHAEQGDSAVHTGDLSAALTSYLAALDCYGGDLLAGERDDEWALLAREHYRVRLLDVLGKAAHVAFDLDRPALAVDLGQRLLALDFCREDLYRLLMRAYARLGQPQLALRQYQTCVRQLRMEFGLDPAPQTVALYDQVRCMVPV